MFFFLYLLQNLGPKKLDLIHNVCMVNHYAFRVTEILKDKFFFSLSCGSYKLSCPNLSPEVSMGRESAVKAPREARPTKMVVARREEVFDIISVTTGTNSMPLPPTKLQKPRPKNDTQLLINHINHSNKNSQLLLLVLFLSLLLL